MTLFVCLEEYCIPLPLWTLWQASKTYNEGEICSNCIYLFYLFIYLSTYLHNYLHTVKTQYVPFSLFLAPRANIPKTDRYAKAVLTLCSLTQIYKHADIWYYSCPVFSFSCPVGCRRTAFPLFVLHRETVLLFSLACEFMLFISVKCLHKWLNLLHKTYIAKVFQMLFK